MARTAVSRLPSLAPWHPGYGNSPLIDGSGSVDDLAYLYLDLASELGLEDAVLVGACFGGWVAAEMMVRSTARFSHLVLIDPLGIKISGREERDIADMHGLSRAEYLSLAWADPAKGEVDFTNLPESELAAIVRGREAFALYGWKPYMHNPRLKRWLHRIEIPTLLLWGAEDRIVKPAYGEGWRQAIPGARLESIPQAGHFPHWEQPEAFVERPFGLCRQKQLEGEQLVESGTCFAGTPDDVYDQFKALSDSVGGFGNLLMFGQGGFLDHKDTVANITLFAKEVLPRLRELNPESREVGAAAE
jgi:pimeloyl-ACP methyl ester carboxylesterase